MSGENPNIDPSGARRAGTIERMTPAENAAVCELIKKICSLIEDENPHLVLQALSFVLLGATQTTYELSPRSAVDFCADCIKRYGQTVLS